MRVKNFLKVDGWQVLCYGASLPSFENFFKEPKIFLLWHHTQSFSIENVLVLVPEPVLAVFPLVMFLYGGPPRRKHHSKKILTTPIIPPLHHLLILLADMCFYCTDITGPHF